jgi:hypothetical protein
MKTKYFTKIENKYVFNLSLIVWHLFIALSTVAIVVSAFLFLWSIIPPSEKKVAKQPYPEMQQLPAPVEVSLSELELEKPGKVESTPVKKATQVKTAPKVFEDTIGKKMYNASIDELKNLIPPSKYSWSGAGHWHYPYGERYWLAYKQEDYRKWIVTKKSVEDKLELSYRVSEANNYSDKLQVLDAYINVVKFLPEGKRLTAFNSLLENTSNSVSRNVDISRSLQKVVRKMDNEENIKYVNSLSLFGKRNPNDGIPFVDYVSQVIDKFDPQERIKTIDYIIECYYYYFNQNLAKQREATDLFIPMLAQIEKESHSDVLLQYYELYLNKNHDRDGEIARIEEEHSQQIENIDNKFAQDKEAATLEYEGKKILKSEFRYRSLLGIGGGILLIVLIGTLLVFLSIQRSVRKIEERISAE